MSIVTPYIPREYLALRINYCKQQLAELPNVVRSERNIRGEKKTVLASGSHYHMINSTSGRKLTEVIQRREELSCELLKLEGLWDSTFRGMPPADIEPRKIKRRFIDSTGESVIIDGKFFESLKHDSNPYYPEHKKLTIITARTTDQPQKPTSHAFIQNRESHLNTNRKSGLAE